MAVTELPRPGIEVVQVFRTTSPTILNPTLPPVIVGVCRQVVDVASGGVVNPDALITLPAFFKAKDATGPSYKYAGLDGLTLSVSVNYGPTVVITFKSGAAGLSPADVCTQVNKALRDAGVTEAVAEVVGNGWRLRTIAVGDSAHLKVVAGGVAVLSAFGLTAGLEYIGTSNYQQYGFQIPTKNFPNPRSNLAYLKIQPETVKVYLSLGTTGSLREVKRTEAFLRTSGTATKATVTGTIDLTTLVYGGGGTVDGDTLTLKLNGGTNVIVTFAAPANAAAIVSAINTALAATVASLNGLNHLVLTSPVAGPTSSIEVVSDTGSVVADLGLTVGKVVGHAVLEALDDGNGDNVTNLVAAYDAAGAVDFPASSTLPSAAVVTAAGVPDLINVDNKTLILSDGRAPKLIEFGVVGALTDIITAINAAFDPLDGIVASDDGGGKLVLTATTKREDGVTLAKGADSQIVILGGTAVNGASNLLDTGGTPALKIGRYEGNPYAAAVGDEVWADGKLLGKVVQVAPGGRTNVLKLDKQVSLSYTAAAWYIEAKNLTTVVTRPKPDLIVDGEGNASVKAAILRDIYGKVVETKVTSGGVTVLLPTKALTYLAYKAVRLDVSPKAKKPGLLAFSSTSQLESIVSPINADNPMGLGTYFALLNAPGSLVNALGVDDIAADAPDGTIEAYVRAFEFLEAVEVYSVAPMTNDSTVAQLVNAHVTTMSEPGNKGERIALFNTAMPTAMVDTLVASGLSGSSTPDATQFDTGIANLSALLLANGLDPTSILTATDGLFLDIATDSKRYSVESITGAVVTVRTLAGDFDPGENDDGFYAESAPPSNLVNEPFALRIRGASLTLPDGSPDKLGMATTLQKIGQGFANRRFWNIVPDKVKATLGGLEQELAGYYMCAAIAGMIAQQPPQQSFTNFPMNGFTGVVGSNDFFTEKQLNIIAAGGNWIVMQEGQGTPLFSRMALTTDLRSVETRTDSITKVVDFTAKFLRTGLKNFIGRFNITQGFVDSLSHVVQGLGTFLVDTGILMGFQMNNIVQDADAPDTVMIDCTLDVPFPCNYIRMTLVI